MATTTPEDWGEQYGQQRGLYEDLSRALERLVRELLEEEGIEVAQIERRAKKRDSFVQKIRRKNEKYANPIAEMTDLAGVRIIAYFPADVRRIGELLETHFAIDTENTKRETGAEDPDRFGYRSDHYVVSMSGSRRELLEYRRFADLRAEIQVRTVMQHAWAAVDHRFRYKKSGLPPELQRRLYRLSALLEVADEQFAAIKSAGDALEATYAGEVERGDLSAGIDALSLRAYLEQTGEEDRWMEHAAAAGLPTWNDNPDYEGTLSRLSEVLRLQGITTLDGLKTFLDGAHSWGEEYLAEISRLTITNGVHLGAFPGDVLILVGLATVPIDRLDEFDLLPALASALRQRNGGPGRAISSPTG